VQKTVQRKLQTVLQIEGEFGIKIIATRENIKLIGEQQRVLPALEKVKLFVRQIEDDLITRQVSTVRECMMLDLIKKEPNFSQTYFCKVVLKINKGVQKPLEEIKADGTSQVKYSIVSQKIQVPQWSFKVFPHDANYHQRQDKANDLFDFDPDQNWQIERHY